MCQYLEQSFNVEDVKEYALTGISLLSMIDGTKARVRRPNIIPINDNNQFDMVILINNQLFEFSRELLLENRNKSFIELAIQNRYVKNLK